MFNLKSLAIAGTLVLGAIATTTGTASAGKVKFGVHVHTPGLHVTIGNRGGRHFGRYHGPRFGYSSRRYRPARVRACTPGKALHKAKRNGIRHAYVHRVGRRGVAIAGRKFGRKIIVGYGKARFCPVRFVSHR